MQSKLSNYETLVITVTASSGRVKSTTTLQPDDAGPVQSLWPSVSAGKSNVGQAIFPSETHYQPPSRSVLVADGTWQAK